MKGINVSAFERLLERSNSGRQKPNESECYIARAYSDSVQNGYEEMVMTDAPWCCQEQEVADAMTSLGVDRFVLADHSTSLLKMIHMFVGFGYELAGIIEVSQEHKKFYRPEWDKPIKGLIFERK